MRFSFELLHIDITERGHDCAWLVTAHAFIDRRRIAFFHGVILGRRWLGEEEGISILCPGSSIPAGPMDHR
jgi:hypothetical protein